MNHREQKIRHPKKGSFTLQPKKSLSRLGIGISVLAFLSLLGWQVVGQINHREDPSSTRDTKPSPPGTPRMGAGTSSTSGQTINPATLPSSYKETQGEQFAPNEDQFSPKEEARLKKEAETIPLPFDEFQQQDHSVQ